MSKAENEEAGSLSKSESAKLNRLYREGKDAYGSVQNLQKASGLPKRKVTDLLYRKNFHEKTSFYFIGWTKGIWEISSHPWLISFLETFNQNLRKFTVFIKAINLFTDYCQKIENTEE